MRKLALPVLLLAVLSASAWASYLYDGSVMPDVAYPTWKLAEGVTQGSIIDDAGDTVYFIPDSSDKKSKWILNTAVNADPLVGVTVVARVKCTAFSDFVSATTTNLGIMTQEGATNMVIAVDPVEGQFAKLRYATTIPNYVAVSAGYHTYRITWYKEGLGTEATQHWAVYIDENPTPALVLDGILTATSSWNSPVFGAGDTSKTQDIYFDWVWTDPTGVRPPGTRLMIIEGPGVYVSGTDATITWKTDVASDSTVYYGNDPENLTLSEFDTAEVTDHQIVLSGLDTSQVWYFKAVSAKSGWLSDESNTKSMSLGIVGPTADPRWTSATIRWSTAADADSIVYYGTDPGDLNQTYSDPTPVENHVAQLTGLDKDQLYFYKVRSEAEGLLPGESGVHSFETLASGELANPNFETGLLDPWVYTYGSCDGIKSGGWFNGMGFNRPAEAGVYYLGNGVSYGTRRCVTSQLVPCDPSTYYIASGWIYTCSYDVTGGLVAYEDNCQNNLGIDPNGNMFPGYDPFAQTTAARLAASTATWFREGDYWTGCSTQIPGTTQAEWKQISVGEISGASATDIAVHLLMHQGDPHEWQLNGWDLISLASAPPATSIDAAKTGQEGFPVSLTGALVSAVFIGDDGQGGYVPASFAIEEADRSLGIRVATAANVNPGDTVDLQGSTALVNGELVMLASSVNVASTGGDAPDPFSVVGIDTGGGAYGAQGAVVNDASADKYAVGMNNVGILVKVNGKVTAANDTGGYDGYFYVDDAYSDAFLGYDTGIEDGSGSIGIRCRPVPGLFNMPGELPAVGSYVDVVGVVGVQEINGKNARYMWTTEWNEAGFSTFTRNHVAKWSLLSLPALPRFADPAIVFGSEIVPDPDKIDGRLYRWDAPTQSLGMYDMWSPDLFGAMNSSEGYWLNAFAAGTVSYSGYTESPALDRWISAPVGWKLMGNPFTTNTWWENWKATDGTDMKSIQDASQYGSNWMQSIGYWWNDSTQSLSDLGLPDDFPQSEELQTWYGYWVKTNKSLGLVAPK